ncbi:MAG: metal-sensing transcriptional repressor [Candidatus Uhrbacteria bacterium]
MSKDTKSPKREVGISLKKAQSLLGKIINMVEDDKYCVDIMQQNLAVIGLLKAANNKLMAGHLDSCVVKALASKNSKKQKQMIEEILLISKLSNK